MGDITLEPNSRKKIKIENGKVGFVWQVKSDEPIKLAIDGNPIQCGYYEPPYVVKKNIVFVSVKRSKVKCYMETYKDIYDIQEKEKPMKIEENPPKKPTIMNHVLNNANTWYEIPIPKDIRTWSMNARGEYGLYYAFEPSHANYRTLFSGMFLDSDTAPNNINTLYVSSNTAGAVVEITIFR